MDWLKNKMVLYAAAGTLVLLLAVGTLLPESSDNNGKLDKWETLEKKPDGTIVKGKTVGTKEIDLFDQQVQMPLAKVRVPEGWQATVATKWDAMADMKIIFSIAITSPDGKEGLNMSSLPMVTYSSDPMFRNIMRSSGMITPEKVWTAREYIENVVLKLLNQQNPEGGPLTLVAVQDGAKNAQNKQQVSFEISNAKIRAFGNIYYSVSQLSLPRDQLYFMDPGMLEIYAGPVDMKLEDIVPRIKLIGESFKINPAWLALVNDFKNKTTEASNKAASERSKMIMDTNKYIADSRRQVFENQTNVNSKIARDWSNTITQKQDVVNPLNNNKVTISDQYKYSWMDSNNNLIQNDNGQYDPKKDPANNNRQWTRVQR